MMRAATVAMALVVGALGIGVVACGDSKPTADARKAIDGRIPDAKPIDAAVAADASLKMCFSNYDCPASEKCYAEPNTFDPKCVAGPRGTGVAGVACTTENDCASALCVEAATGQGMKCSDRCAGPQDCPASLPRCVNVIGEMMCVRPL